MALTKLLSIEGAPHNILANAMLVGFIEADQHVQRAAKEGIPLRTISPPRQGHSAAPHRQGEEFANLACFLPGAGVVYRRHRDQRRRRAFAGV